MMAEDNSTPHREYFNSCGECGMPVGILEYHPYAACLMFKACGDARTVRENLRMVIETAPRDFIKPDTGEWASESQGAPALPNPADAISRKELATRPQPPLTRVLEQARASREQAHGLDPIATPKNCCCGDGRVCPSHGDTTPHERPENEPATFPDTGAAVKKCQPR